GQSLELLPAGFDCDLGMGRQVVIPGRVGRGPAFGGDDDVVALLPRVDQGVLAVLAGFGAPGGQDQDVTALEGTAGGLAAVLSKVLDQVAVEIEVAATHTRNIPGRAALYSAVPGLTSFAAPSSFSFGFGLQPQASKHPPGLCGRPGFGLRVALQSAT